MDLGPILEVAIGIIFVWIVLSLTVIQIQEWISTKLDKRAQDLEATIHEMLANPNLKDQFYDHPVIRGLTAKDRKRPSIVPPWFYNFPIVRGFTEEVRKLPSYIPSQQFTLSLFEIARTAGTESSLIQQGIYKIRDDFEKDKKKFAPPKTPGNEPLTDKKQVSDESIIDALNILADIARSAAADEAGTAVTNITKDTLKAELEAFTRRYPHYDFASAIDRALNEAKIIKNEIQAVLKKQKLGKDHETAFIQIREGIAALSVISPELNQTMNALFLNVEGLTKEKEEQYANAKQSVEKWFDDSMDRVSGTFKRYSQMMALIIGIVVSIALNVDSINLTLYLWREPSVRQALADNATAFEIPQEQFDTNPEQAMQAFRERFVGLNLPVGWVIDESGGMAVYDNNCQLFPGIDQEFGIPLFPTNKCITPPQSNNQTNIALKLIGILITAFAARLGAPFWFDILKKAVNLRGTGANPVEKGITK